jgi:hypothetical protein
LGQIYTTYSTYCANVFCNKPSLSGSCAKLTEHKGAKRSDKKTHEGPMGNRRVLYSAARQAPQAF